MWKRDKVDDVLERKKTGKAVVDRENIDAVNPRTASTLARDDNGLNLADVYIRVKEREREKGRKI